MAAALFGDGAAAALLSTETSTSTLTTITEEGVRYPRCVKGGRACPPENCGGPYGYPYFLEKIQDPENEEHEDALEWVGDEFDPDEFDLDEVNEGLRHLRRWLGKRKGRHALQADFAKGDLVYVKLGVVHEQRRGRIDDSRGIARHMLDAELETQHGTDC